jgi:hypothetical protein
MFSPPRPALSTDAQAAWDDHDTYAPYTTSEATMAKYQTLFSTSPGIAGAMDYATLDSSVRSQLWSKIDAAEVAGGVADFADLADYPADPMAVPGPFDQIVDYTATELRNSHSAKLAHALYVDINDLVAWKLNNFTEDDLRLLLDPLYIYAGSYDLGESPAAHDYYISDHSPYRAYAQAVLDYGDNTNLFQAVSSLDKDFVEPFRHSTTGAPTDPYWVVDVVDVLTVNPARPTEGTFFRSGCQSAARAMVALARSLNIPSMVIQGATFSASVNHASAVFPTLNRIYAHADYMYTTKFVNGIRGIAMSDSWAYWQANIVGQSDATVDELSKLALERDHITKWPESPGLIAKFVNESEGWSYIDTYLTEVTQGERDELYYDLVELTGDDGGGGQ